MNNEASRGNYHARKTGVRANHCPACHDHPRHDSEAGNSESRGGKAIELMAAFVAQGIALVESGLQPAEFIKQKNKQAAFSACF